jgi:hypothetical protein
MDPNKVRRKGTRVLLFVLGALVLLMVGIVGPAILAKHTVAAAEEKSVCQPHTDLDLVVSTQEQRKCDFLRFPGEGCEVLPVQYCTSANACFVNSVSCVPLTSQQWTSFRRVLVEKGVKIPEGY